MFHDINFQVVNSDGTVGPVKTTLSDAYMSWIQLGADKTAVIRVMEKVHNVETTANIPAVSINIIPS